MQINVQQPLVRKNAPLRLAAASGLLSLSSVRWASAALALFLAGLAAQLMDGPAALWWSLYLACYLTGGWAPAWDGLQALRSRTLDVDLLMIVAAVGAATIGQIFDGALLIVIFATSGALEDAATKRTEDSVKDLLDLAPDQAIRIEADDTESVVKASELQIDDEVLIRPGERVSADGIVIDGASEVDQSSVTGESLSAWKSLGDKVFAGTLNGAGMLRVRVTEDPAETVVARIVALVVEASATKAKTQLFIEKVEQRYSMGVVVATLALFLIPLAAGADFQSALLRAMTFMIVASPCAVVLATMPPLLSAIANAGRHGVLVKSAVALEHLADTSVVAFDKTGTLTTGELRLTTVVDIDERTRTENAVLRLAAAAEQFSEHPIGRAVVRAAREHRLDIPSAAEFCSLPGRGVRATVESHTVEVLNPRGLAQPLPDVALLQESGATAVVVVIDGAPSAVLGIADTVRAGADRVVNELATVTGNSPVMLTGDNLGAARSVANQVGINTISADLLPADKVESVRYLQASGQQVLLVGDGINDAPAMATAHASIAMGRGGADLTLHTADAVTVRDELDTIPALLTLARRARRTVIANLVIASTFIVALVAWDLLGDLPLPLGVAGHEGSTIIVALNGLRLLGSRSWG